MRRKILIRGYLALRYDPVVKRLWIITRWYSIGIPLGRTRYTRPPYFRFQKTLD